MTIKLKLTRQVTPIKLANSNFAYISVPGSNPTIVTSSISVDSQLAQYSNTEQMLGNVATAYSNSINFVETNYINASSLELTSLNDIDDTLKSNNATLVYNTESDKYVVKQIDLDGGNF